MIKSQFIIDILTLLLDDEKIDSSLRKQIDYLTEAKFEYTGSGVFINFFKENGIDNYKTKLGEPNQVLNGVEIINKSINVNAEAILFVRKGIIDYLEVWNRTGDYPNKELKEYTITQNWSDSKGKTIKR